MRKLTHEEIVFRQQGLNQQPSLPLVVVLNNIRSLYNIGSIFRTADGAGVAKIFLCGICGYPPNERISKTALGAENNVAWEYRQEAVSLLKELKNDGYQIVLLEQTADSVPYDRFCPSPAVCLVIGNEIEGISPSLVPLSDAAIEIGMRGIKNSLNVAVAFGVAAFHLRRCFQSHKEVLHAKT